MKEVKLSLELAMEMYGSGNEELKKFALENYSKHELTKPKRPNTVIGMPVANTYYIDTNSQIGFN